MLSQTRDLFDDLVRDLRRIVTALDSHEWNIRVFAVVPHDSEAVSDQTNEKQYNRNVGCLDMGTKGFGRLVFTRRNPDDFA